MCGWCCLGIPRSKRGREGNENGRIVEERMREEETKRAREEISYDDKTVDSKKNTHIPTRALFRRGTHKPR